MESIKNVFNFSVPFLSWLAFVVIFIVTIVLYFVPLRFVPDHKIRGFPFSTSNLSQGSVDIVGDK